MSFEIIIFVVSPFQEDKFTFICCGKADKFVLEDCESILLLLWDFRYEVVDKQEDLPVELLSIFFRGVYVDRSMYVIELLIEDAIRWLICN